MGHTQAIGMAEEVFAGALAIEAAVAWHLSANHYPPVPTSMIGPCLEAIDLVNGGAYEAPVRLPEGVTYRGASTAPAHAIVNGHHLAPFLEEEEFDG